MHVIEYLEKYRDEYQCEQWLVRVDDRLGIAHIYHAADRGWLHMIDDHTAMWLGFTHPSVVPILTTTLDDDKLVIVTGDGRGPPFVSGAKLLADPVERELWATTQIASVAEGLAMMGWRHKGYVYRRANHEQIVVGADGRARLCAPIAWVAHPRGIGWVGRGNAITGLAWLSPEQCLGLPATPASDVFQLAATLYAALTLERPFQGTTDFETLRQITQGPLPSAPACTPALASLIMANLARDPDERDRDPGEFGAKLRAIHPGDGANARSLELLYARVAAARPNDHKPPHESAAIRGWRCAKSWDQLAPTATDGIRHCGECKHDVVEVRSIKALIPLLGKRCVSYVPE